MIQENFMFNLQRMSFILSMVVVALIIPRDSSAQGHVEASIEDPAKLVARETPRPGMSLFTESGDAVLLLKENAIVIQMTDEGLRYLGRSDRSESRGSLGAFVSAIVHAGITEMLDRGISYPLTMLDHATAEGNRLYLVDLNGKLVFDTMNINNARPMHDFAPGEASVFAKRINAAIKRTR
jgi:hypothetical protein